MILIDHQRLIFACWWLWYGYGFRYSLLITRSWTGRETITRLSHVIDQFMIIGFFLMIVCGFIAGFYSFPPLQMTNINDVFSQTMRKISSQLENNVKTTYQEIFEDLQKQIKTKPFLLKKEKLEKKKELIQSQREELWRQRDMLYQTVQMIESQLQNITNEMRELDPVMKIESRQEEVKNTPFFALPFAPSLSCIRETEYKACKTAEKSKHYRNFIAWEKIEEKYRAMMNLAISNAQKQKIVIELQNAIDWHSLWIDIPTLFQIQEIKVVKGEIILNNALPSPEATE